MEFHLRGSDVFEVDEESLRDEIRSAYELWRADFEKRPGMNPDGLLRKVMDDDFAWNYNHSFDLSAFMKSVLEGAMVNHRCAARYFKADESERKTSIVLRYADGSPMKPVDIAYLKWFNESGAFDKVEED